MKAYSKVLAVSAAFLLLGALAGTALAIEAFSERFEEDFSTPKTILARVIVVDPYEDAVWINWVWKGVRNGGEIDQFWARMLPGKNMRVFATGADLAALKAKARPGPGPAASEKVPPTSATDVVEMAVQEVEQNRRVATNVKDVDDKLWTGVVAGGSTAIFPGQRAMKAEANFPEMKAACGTFPGKPGVPIEVLGEDLPGGSTLHSKNVLFKHLPVGCTGEAPKPAAGAH
jgi:hypothetical protein